MEGGFSTVANGCIHWSDLMNYPRRLHFLSRRYDHGLWVSKCLEFSLISHSMGYKMSMYTLCNLCSKYLETYDSQRPSSSLYNRAGPWDWLVFYGVTLLNQFNIRPDHVRVRTIHDYPFNPQ